MDSLAAAPGTGPATSPLPVLRKPRPAAKFQDLPTDRTLVMGILNVTPDSFSDGGSTRDAGHGDRRRAADVLRRGGHHRRRRRIHPPGCRRRSAPDEEQSRILPVIEALVKAGALISVDTMHAATAAAALDAGAPSSTTFPA